jgi:carbon storage regulator CsrA
MLILVLDFRYNGPARKALVCMDVESAELLVESDNPVRQEVIMLVLSRTEGDGISFPELDLAIQILKVQGSRVQIGVKATEAIRVLRSELLGRAAKKLEPENAEARHDLRNRLNAVSLAMSISQKHLERGDLKKAELALEQIATKIQSISASVPFPGRCNVDTRRVRVEDIPSSAANVKVLLVEDNANERSLLGELLQINGFDVHVSKDGDEAIRSMETRIPDVVLLDMNMPGRDGPSTMQCIRKNPRLRDLKIYAVSGSDQEKLGVPTDPNIGVDQWFQKPFQPQSLLQAIRCFFHENTNCDELLQVAP